MKEIKMATYDSFSCIADKCSLTCCQEWKISVDSETLDRWKQMEKSSDEELLKHVDEEEDSYIIKLNEERKCPHLREDKLCSLVAKYGEECISETCKIFPREIHDFGNRTEYTLVACCPEVVDMLHNKQQVELIGENEEFEEDVLYSVRKLIMSILSDSTISLSEGFMVGFYIMLALFEKEEITVEDLIPYKEPEVVQKLVKTIEEMDFNKLDTFDECNELFLDISDNYRKQKLYVPYLESIGQEAEQLSEGYEVEEIQNSIEMFQKEMQKMETLLRNYVVSEVYNAMLIPESDYYSMVVMMQWIGLEYAVMLHVTYLKWKQNGCMEIDYETVRSCIVIIARMTGYDQEDIFDYLENSFQDLIWDWGYFALVLGKER